MTMTYAFRSIDETEGWQPLDPEIPVELLTGHPQVRLLDLSQGRGGLDAVGFATGEPSRFRIALESTEVLLVLEGRLTAELDDGTTVTVGPGESIQLDAGQSVTWTYLEPVRLFYVLQSPVTG